MPVVARNRLLTKIDKHGKYKGDLCNQVEVEANIIDLISGDTRMNLKVFRSNGEDYYLMDRKNFDIKNFTLISDVVNLVNGKIATSKIINGTERSRFTTIPRTELIALFSAIPPLSVTNRTTPSGIPNK